MRKALFALLVATAMLSSASLLTVNTFAENANCSIDCEAPTIGRLNDGQRIVEKGFVLNGRSVDVERHSQYVSTTTLNTGGVAKATLIVYENNGVSSIREVALIISDYKDDRNRNDLASISFVQDFTGQQSVRVVDQNGMIKDVTIKPTVIDQFRMSLEFSFKVVQPVDKSAIIVTSWDNNRSSRTNVLLDAIAATGKPIVENVPMTAKDIAAPLKQVKSGKTPSNVECRQGLELVFRTGSGAPACVYPFTAETLRSWGMVR